MTARSERPPREEAAPPSVVENRAAARYRGLPTGNEPARIAVTIVNFLNRQFFKGRSKRKTNPERPTILACLHDRNDAGHKCRPHLRILIGLPPNVSVVEFTN